VPEHELNTGDRVRIKPDCPHTLPAYARMLEGVVTGTDDQGFVVVRFGEDRIFPVAAECLYRTAEAPR